MHDAVRQSILNLISDQAEARRKDIEEKIAYYDFDRRILQEKIKQWIMRKEKDIPYSMQNITKYIVNRQSVVYEKPPVRTPAIEKEFPDEYTEATEDKDDSMKIVERRTNLLGRPALGILWDQEDEKFDYKIIQYYTVKLHLGKVIQLIYEVNTDYMDERLFVVWTPEQHFISDIQGTPAKRKVQEQFGVENKDLINPYETIPFMFPYKEKPLRGFDVEGATDVIESNEKINLSLTLLNYLERYSSYKQAFVQSPSSNLKKQEVDAGYNKILTLAGEGTIGVLDIQADLNQIVESIKFKMNLVLQMNHLSIDFGGDGRASSGFQLIVENIPLLKWWADAIDIWRVHEREIYKKEKVVFEFHTERTLPDKQKVDFAEVEFPVSPDERRKQDDWELLHNQTTELKIAQRENPDADAKDLEKELEANTVANKQEPDPKPPVTIRNLNKGVV